MFQENEINQQKQLSQKNEQKRLRAQMLSIHKQEKRTQLAIQVARNVPSTEWEQDSLRPSLMAGKLYCSESLNVERTTTLDDNGRTVIYDGNRFVGWWAASLCWEQRQEESEHRSPCHRWSWTELPMTKTTKMSREDVLASVDAIVALLEWCANWESWWVIPQLDRGKKRIGSWVRSKNTYELRDDRWLNP